MEQELLETIDDVDRQLLRAASPGVDQELLDVQPVTDGPTTAISVLIAVTEDGVEAVTVEDNINTVIDGTMATDIAEAASPVAEQERLDTTDDADQQPPQPALPFTAALCDLLWDANTHHPPTHPWDVDSRHCRMLPMRVTDDRRKRCRQLRSRSC